jgi:hypothetical protein
VGFIIVARDLLDRSTMFLNLLLFSQLRTRCSSQQLFCDTVAFVHTHPSEAV